MIDLIFAVAAAAAQPATPPPASELGEVRMHLFYHADGLLSPDISPPNAWDGGWNTVIFADDLVIVAEVTADGERSIDRPLRIVARGRGNRILGQRRLRSILTSHAGRAYLPLWLNDVTCEGDIHVTVTYGTQSRTEMIPLHCGE